MKIGVIPPVPMEPFSASAHDVTNLWSAFFLASDREVWLETARVAGFPDNYSVWARCLYGMACEMRLEAVHYPEPGLPQEIHRAVQLLREQEVAAHPFAFPILRNEERLRESLEALSRSLEVEPAVLESVMQRWTQVKTSLRRFDGLQQRSAGFSSNAYVSMLARSMDPGRDLEGLKRSIDAGILAYEDAGRSQWTRVGLLGLTPYREGFYEFLEARRTVVVYDEWGVENNPMASASSLAHLYEVCSLPYGLKRRLDKLRREIETRHIRGVLLGVEYLADSLRDEGFFRANLQIPVFVVENAAGGTLDESDQRALGRFLESCGKA